ncbi:MAG: MMPL family transporter [Bacteroidales bacterium]|nr:MMPL family transporter [Bacteroidales bacterium]
MERIFIPIYRFFAARRGLMYTILVVSALVFAFFAFKLSYEEDLSKLLPKDGRNNDSGLVFGNLRVKDKIFIQFVPREGTEMDDESLASCVDSFMEGLEAKDSNSTFIANTLYRVDDETVMNALDFGLMNLASFVDASSYSRFDSLLTPEALEYRMAENLELVMDDWDGTKSMLAGYDPAGLRYALLEGVEGAGDGLGGFRMAGRHFFAKDSLVALAFVSPNFKSFDSKSNSRLIGLIESRREEFAESDPGIEVLFHGAPVLSANNSTRIKKDVVMTIGLSLLIICFVIGLCFRNRSSLFLMVEPVLYGTFFAMACMYWIKGTMSLMSLGIGAVVLGVALSYVLHVLTHYKFVSDPETVIREQATPVILGCLTTIGAFAGLLFTQSALLQDFGIFASLALVATTLFSLIFMPHFFSPEDNRKNEKAFGLLDTINSYPLDRKGVLLVCLTLLIVASFFTCGRVGFDNNLKNIGYVSPEVSRSQELYSDLNSGGKLQMYFAASSEDLDSALVASRGMCRALDSLSREGLADGYTKSSSLFIPQSEQQRNIDAWKNYWTPERVMEVRRNVSRAALNNGLSPDMFEGFFALTEADYEPSSLYDSGVIPESMLSNFIEESDGKYLVFTSSRIEPEAKQQVCDAVASVPHAVVVDPFYYMADLVDIIHRDFNIVLWISMIFVFVVLLVSFRSLFTALLAFMPMFVSWYVVQGVMGVTGLEFNLLNIVISTFVFGIGVDYSIFVMDGLLAAERGENTRLLSYHKTAISLSAFILIVVVGSLIFAVHPAINSIGVISIIGMVSTVLITYSLQPFLFRLMIRNPFLRRRMVGEKHR